MTKNDELRCHKCHKLLGKHDLRQNTLEIKCVRCGSLNSIFKGISEQVVVTDPNGKIIYANSLVESTTGYSLAEIIGSKPSLWGGQMPKQFYKKIWDQIKLKKKPISVKMTNKRKDGTLYKVTLKISPVFDSRGKIKMFVGMESMTK